MYLSPLTFVIHLMKQKLIRFWICEIAPQTCKNPSVFYWPSQVLRISSAYLSSLIIKSKLNHVILKYVPSVLVVLLSMEEI